MNTPHLMTDEPITPGQVKALHRADEQEMCTTCRFGDGSYVIWPCLPYLLADRLATAEAERARWQAIAERLDSDLSAVAANAEYTTELRERQQSALRSAWKEGWNALEVQLQSQVNTTYWFEQPNPYEHEADGAPDA
jgi:hypothetical protein